jgi:C4-dicarboxylate-specific signal transduction histidine kinase
MAAWATCDTMGEFAVKHRIRRAADHIYRWFQSRATPVRAEGRIVGGRGKSTDVEDQARVREALERSSEELEARVPERTAELQAALDAPPSRETRTRVLRKRIDHSVSPACHFD